MKFRPALTKRSEKERVLKNLRGGSQFPEQPAASKIDFHPSAILVKHASGQQHPATPPKSPRFDFVIGECVYVSETRVFLALPLLHSWNDLHTFRTQTNAQATVGSKRASSG